MTDNSCNKFCYGIEVNLFRRQILNDITSFLRKDVLLKMIIAVHRFGKYSSVWCRTKIFDLDQPAFSASCCPHYSFMYEPFPIAKVSCILCHRGVQLILAYSWARPAILVAGKGREVMFLFLLFLHFHSYSSFFPVPLFHLFCYLFCLFSPFLWETTQNDPQGLTCR